MADEVRDYLTSEIETLRSAVFRAGVLNAKTLRPCADAHIDTILRYVAASPDLDESTYQTISRIAVFARALYTQAQIAEIEQARREALVAIDAFGVVVDGALGAGAAATQRHHEGGYVSSTASP